MIVPPKPSEFQTQEVELRSEIVDQGDEQGIKWTFDSDSIVFQLRCVVESTHDGVVFVEFEEQTGYQEELIYSDELKTWLSPRLTEAFHKDKLWDKGVPIPYPVLVFLKQAHGKMMQKCANMAQEFRTHYFREPWRVVPHWIKGLATRCSVQVGDVEGKILKYSFQNPMLLI